MAVEITLLKAATFPRLRAVEEALSGGERPSPALRAPSPRTRGEGTGDLGTLVERIKSKKPLIATYLDSATSANKNGNRITWTFSDPAYVDYVNDARGTIEQIASEVFGETTTIEAVAEAPQTGRRAEDKQQPQSALRDDPVMRAFQKHLGAEPVESRRSK